MNTNANLIWRRKHIQDREQSRERGQAVSRPAVMTNRLEALKVLANSILAEAASLETNLELTDAVNVDLAGEVQRYEADLIRTALIRTGGRQRRAAALLSIKPTTLHEKMKRYGMITAFQDVGPESGSD